MTTVVCYAAGVVVLGGTREGGVTVIGGAPGAPLGATTGPGLPLDQLVASALRGVMAATAPARAEARAVPRDRSPRPDPPAPGEDGHPRLPDGPTAEECREQIRTLIDDWADVETANGVFGRLDELHRAATQQAVADVWRRVGRALLGAGGGGDQAGGLAWRRLYLTEIAPWADYAEGDEYRFLGMPAPPPTGQR